MAGATFAMARIRFPSAVPWSQVLPILARGLPGRHVFAAYGPRDYEILFVDVKRGEPERLLEGLLASFAEAQLQGRTALAWYPQDGRTGDALFARAQALLTSPPDPAGDASTSATVAPMQRVRAMAARAASSSINVLVLGETGVGKEVLARLVHQLSPRRDMPLVAVNCAGLPESLIESELFGYEKGAFTGATAAKVGLLESANGGTVFLDEIGEMSLPLQARLLRVIEAREVLPVGAVRPRPIDVRFISATNRDLETAAASGQFRRDLFYRLNGISLAIPPLRERTDEIAELTTTFVAQASRDMNRDDQPSVVREAMDYLLGYDWPGNIRELKNAIDRALVLCDGPEIRPEHLPLEKMRSATSSFTTEPALPVVVPVPGGGLPPLQDPKKAAERQRILDALEACVSNQTRAARLLHMSRRTLISKLDYYGIPRPQKGAVAQSVKAPRPIARDV
jgi:DNA-binding NtrC family response regulator